MGAIDSVVLAISNILYQPWFVPLILIGGAIYLTIRCGFLQFGMFREACKVIMEKPHEGGVSSFGALMVSTASRVGTGNIIGVATAVALGGPGAVFWCWLTGVFGIATKYTEGLLAIKYRIKTENGEMLGGPMYALERGLKLKWLGILFCIFTALAAFGIGNTVQANSISLLLNETWGISVHLTGGILALTVALVILFGVKGIANVCGALVPFMAIFYILGCIYI